MAEVYLYLIIASTGDVRAAHPTWSAIDVALSSKYPALRVLKIHITFVATVVYQSDFQDDEFNKETKKYLDDQFARCRHSNRIAFDIDFDCDVEALEEDYNLAVYDPD